MSRNVHDFKAIIYIFKNLISFYCSFAVGGKEKNKMKSILGLKISRGNQNNQEIRENCQDFHSTFNSFQAVGGSLGDLHPFEKIEKRKVK